MSDESSLFILKVESYDKLSQEGHLGFWLINAKSLDEAKLKLLIRDRELLRKDGAIETPEISEGTLEEINEHFGFNFDKYPLRIMSENYN